MTTLRGIIKDITARHEERMRADPHYAMTFALMKEDSKPVEPTRHYDRYGYCDNPARGY